MRAAREVDDKFTSLRLSTLRTTPIPQRTGKAFPPIPDPIITDTGACPLCNTPILDAPPPLEALSSPMLLCTNVLETPEGGDYVPKVRKEELSRDGLSP